MTNYIYVSNLIKEGIPREIINCLLAEILEITLPAKSDYPDYEKWFLERFVPGLFKGTRDIVLAIQKGKIIGVANLKNENEKKICTLYIKPRYQKRKEGILLVEKSFDFLGTSKPIITMPLSKVKQFYPIIKKYGWSLSEEIDDCYKKNVQELVFNSEAPLLSASDTLPVVLEKIYHKKWNSNITKFHIPSCFRFLFYKKSV